MKRKKRKKGKKEKREKGKRKKRKKGNKVEKRYCLRVDCNYYFNKRQY